MAILDIGEGEGVSEYSFFLKVANEAVAGSWRDEVGDEHAVKEDALGSNTHEFHEPAWLGYLEECQEVHPLIVSFLQ